MVVHRDGHGVIRSEEGNVVIEADGLYIHALDCDEAANEVL